MIETLHVVPTADLVEHDTRLWNSCPCGPDFATQRTSKGIGITITHHSLDGREASE